MICCASLNILFGHYSYHCIGSQDRTNNLIFYFYKHLWNENKLEKWNPNKPYIHNKPALKTVYLHLNDWKWFKVAVNSSRMFFFVLTHTDEMIYFTLWPLDYCSDIDQVIIQIPGWLWMLTNNIICIIIAFKWQQLQVNSSRQA